MEQKIQLLTKQAPPPAGPYSQGIETEQFVFVSGQRPVDPVTGETVYLSDISYFDDMNEVYRAMISEPFPARSTFGVQLRGILVEIDVIAKKTEN